MVMGVMGERRALLREKWLCKQLEAQVIKQLDLHIKLNMCSGFTKVFAAFKKKNVAASVKFNYLCFLSVLMSWRGSAALAQVWALFAVP